MNLKPIKELVGMMMLGEGIIGFFAPKKYSLFWKFRFAPIETLKRKAAENPEKMRFIYLAEAGLGFWLMKSQLKNSIEREKRIE